MYSILLLINLMYGLPFCSAAASKLLECMHVCMQDYVRILCEHFVQTRWKILIESL